VRERVEGVLSVFSLRRLLTGNIHGKGALSELRFCGVAVLQSERD